MKVQEWQVRKYLPELHDIPQEKKAEIVEIARYQSFKENGNYRKLGWSHIGLGLLIFFLGFGLFALFTNFFKTNTSPFTGIIGGVIGSASSIIPLLLYQKAIIKRMRPKIQELAERYRLECEDQTNAATSN